MSDDEVVIIIAQRESDLVARGITPYPGSIVDYCPTCRTPVRLSPKSQKTIKNRRATFRCPLCMETKILPAMKPGNPVVMHATNMEDFRRVAAMVERAGRVAIPLTQQDAPICEPCEISNHDGCFGQGCGCKPCQTDGSEARA